MYPQYPAQPAPGVRPIMCPRPLPKFAMGNCPVTRTRTIGVQRFGQYYMFNKHPASPKLVPHKCLQCQARVTEADLYPKYSVVCNKTSTLVIFVHNGITNKIEQYAYSHSTGGFVEVSFPELVYNPSLVTHGNLVVVIKGLKNENIVIERDLRGGIRKQSSHLGPFQAIPPVVVRTLMMQEIEKGIDVTGNPENPDSAVESDYDSEEDDEDEDDEDDLDVDDLNYLDSLPTFKVRICQASQKEVVCVINSCNGNYIKYIYNDHTGNFDFYQGTSKFEVTEDSLVAKYSEFHQGLKKYVFHVHNLESNLMEKYYYQAEFNSLVQTHCNDLIYDPAKITQSHVLAVINRNDLPQPVVEVIVRNLYGKIRKEIPEMYGFIQTPVTVKTFIVQMEEERRKKTKIIYDKVQLAKKKNKEIKLKKKVLEEEEKTEKMMENMTLENSEDQSKKDEATVDAEIRTEESDNPFKRIPVIDAQKRLIDAIFQRQIDCNIEDSEKQRINIDIQRGLKWFQECKEARKRKEAEAAQKTLEQKHRAALLTFRERHDDQ
ncbi:SKN-1 Dependent Zygotic transcript [Caenorhabditis elegans]|uniref:SKN-1 Dependent Zygotic transcript n=1 Tax=Caenorhabditis elegans TaxID=6239 RepID=O02297_CAEEL|nr:SKN-1 Dependent Zygotic transcript [Caenorhabditis elegans]CAB03286.2 SKN-1 Dependent Zygotic transcript [Caenorhabditis elegans]|eukprot:NP_493341.2 SKN-1 Dependent Zygotic transcript [Caenorhabditis elegans]